MRTLGQYMAGSGATFGFVAATPIRTTTRPSTDVAQILHVNWQHNPFRRPRRAPRIVSKSAAAPDRPTGSPRLEEGIMIPFRAYAVSIFRRAAAVYEKAGRSPDIITMGPVRSHTCIYPRSLCSEIQSIFGYRTSLVPPMVQCASPAKRFI